MSITRKLYLIAFIPLAALSLLAGYLIWEKYSLLHTVGIMDRNAHFLEACSELTTAMQVERGQTNIVLGNGGSKDRMLEARKQTDLMLELIKPVMAAAAIDDNSRRLLSEAITKTLPAIRAAVDSSGERTRIFQDYTKINQTALLAQGVTVKAKTDRGMGKW